MSVLDRLRAQPAGLQVVLASVAALLLAAILALAWFAMRPRYEVLFSDLRPADAATIVAELEKSNVPHKLRDGGAVILAPAGRVDEIRLGIMGADLPLKGTVGFELFNKSDMGLTEFAQRINYQRALQGELARTIMTIEAVDTARVHLTLPEPSIFRAERKPAEASVTLTTRPGRTLTPETVLGIQRLVGAAASDLDAASVVVLNAQGASVGGAAAPLEAPSGDIPAGLQQIRAVEQYYAAGVRRALEPLYPGVSVVVLAPLDQWAAGGVPAREQDIADWRPDRRDFQLRVSVSRPQGFGPAQREDVGRIVAAAADLSADRGDVVLFPDWAPSAEAADDAAPASRVAAAGSDPAALAAATGSPGSLGSPILAWAAAALGATGLLALILLRRARKGAALTPDAREAYVRRLKRLLAEDAGHAG